MIGNLYSLFLGSSPNWYKNTIIAFLIFNPICFFLLNQLNFNGGFIIGWFILLEFIFTLALALKCYPLQPGGLLLIQAIIIDLTNYKYGLLFGLSQSFYEDGQLESECFYGDDNFPSREWYENGQLRYEKKNGIKKHFNEQGDEVDDPWG